MSISFLSVCMFILLFLFNFHLDHLSCLIFFYLSLGVRAALITQCLPLCDCQCFILGNLKAWSASSCQSCAMLFFFSFLSLLRSAILITCRWWNWHRNVNNELERKETNTDENEMERSIENDTNDWIKKHTTTTTKHTEFRLCISITYEMPYKKIYNSNNLS